MTPTPESAAPTAGVPATPPDEPTTPPESSKEENGLLAFLIARQSWVVIVVALVAAMLIGAALIRYQGVNPWYAYQTLFMESLGSPSGLSRTLEKTTPLILTGLAVALPLRVGLFNIGGQGQLIMGAIGAAWVGYAARDLGVLAFVLAAVAGVLAGAATGAIAGVLKTSRGVHEVISTIMLNSIAAGVTWWLVVGPLKAAGQSGIPQTESIGEGARLGALAGIPLGFPIAVVLALVAAWMLTRTTLGFTFNTVGKNKHAAGYAGIPIRGITFLVMVIGGGLAGLAGGLEVTGVMHRFEPAIGGTLGFDGITIALLARSNPIGTIPASLLVGALRTGAPGLQFATGIAPEVVDLLLAVTLLFVSIPVLGKWIFRSRAAKVTVSTTSWGS